MAYAEQLGGQDQYLVAQNTSAEVIPLHQPLTVHLIGNAHIDVPWQWPLRESYWEARSTFRSALDRMDEYDDFIFTASSPALYDHIRRTDKGMFREIQDRVAAGKWELGGGMWVEPDCNLPSGESLARQLLYGQRFYYDEFGKIATVGMNPDTFGHAATLPKILRASGIEAYTFMRPQRGEMAIPHGPFRWIGDDGSMVLAQRIPFEYAVGDTVVQEHIDRSIKDHDGKSKQVLVFYGVGNHGGGPTKRDIGTIKSMQETSTYDMRFSTLEAYFRTVEEEKLDLTPISGELQRHAPGCYSAGSEFKRLNRRAENAQLAAEKTSVTALYVAKRPYNPDRFRELGQTKALADFHDTMGTTLSKKGQKDAENSLAAVVHLAEKESDEAFLSIAENIFIEQEGKDVTPIIAHNPHAWDVTTPVEVELYDFDENRDILVAIDYDNDEKKEIQIPVQQIQPEVPSGGRYRICFIGEIPSGGYRVFKVRRKERKEPDFNPDMKATNTTIENERFSLEIDEETGYIKSLSDKKFEEEEVTAFRNLAGKLPTNKDNSDTWGHLVYKFDKMIGAFKPAGQPKLVEHGPVKSVIRVKYQYGDSTLVQDYTMYTGIDGVRIDAKLNWGEKHTMLKTTFPVEIEARENTFEVPYGTVARGEYGDEVPGQSFVDVSGVYRKKNSKGVGSNLDYGVSIINDSKYGHHILNREVGVTITRSTVHSWHDPFPLDPERDYDYMDQGPQEYSLFILPHEGSWKDAQTDRKATEFNQPVKTLVASGNEHGTLPQVGSFYKIEKPNVILNVIKRPEDPRIKATVLRFVEMHNKPATSKVRLADREFYVALRPSGLKTVVVPDNPEASVFETDIPELLNLEDSRN